MSDSVQPHGLYIAHQAPLSMGFARQQYWSGLLFPSPEDPPDLGIELTSLKSPALAVGFSTTSTTWEALYAVLSHSVVSNSLQSHGL